MKKILILLFLFTIISLPLFAGVSSGGLGGLPDSVLKPINFILSLLKAIAIIAIVVSIIITAIKYISSDAGRRQEILKSGIVAVIVSAVILLAAFSLPSVLGLDGTTISDSAVISIENTV